MTTPLELVARTFDLERSSNPLRVRTRPLPAPADLVGQFTVSREIVSAGPHSGTVRRTAEGDGLLSTFTLPEPEESGFRKRVTGGSTEAALAGNRLKSRKTLEVEIVPDDNTTNIVLPSLSFRQFDPRTRSISTLHVAETSLRFALPEAKKPEPVPMPETEDRMAPAVWAPAALSAAVALYVIRRPKRKPKTPKLTALFQHRKSHMQIPNNAAQGLYQQIAGGIVAMLYHWTWPLPNGQVSFMKNDHKPPPDLKKMTTAGTDEHKEFHRQ